MTPRNKAKSVHTKEITRKADLGTRSTSKNVKNLAKGPLSEVFDVVVIGGGPAGMTAANQAASRGLRVVLLEKNTRLGEKLLITGGGRCNMTNAEFDNRALLTKFKDAGKFLFSPFSKYSVQNTLDYFHARGLNTKIENEKRVFPVTDKAQSVWDVLVRDLKQNGVQVKSNIEVTGFVLSKDKSNIIAGVNTREKGVIFGKAFILATGGKSHPETGSTGEGFEWLSKIGHTVREPSSSLVPIRLKQTKQWFKDLQGISLQNIRISIFENQREVTSSTQDESGVVIGGAIVKTISHRKFYKDGKLLFTHFGITGPTILNMSKEIGDLVAYSDVSVHIDLFPKMNHKEIDKNLLETFAEQNTKKIKNGFGVSRTDILSTQPRALFPIILKLAKIDPEKTCATITKDERARLVHTMKGLVLDVEGLLGAGKAIVTSGGIALDEIDWKTMSSTKYPNLHMVGDILDIDRPSGGYSLQLCWTTGFVAGDSVLKESL